MGAAFRKLLSKQEARVIMQGLDAAGKTTILYKLKLGEIVTTIPTIGFNVETLEYKNISFTTWDIGGRDKIRPLYRHYYQNTQAFIFVVDSNDRERLEQVEEELSQAMAEDELRDIPVLIYLNKQDLPNALSVLQVTEALKLHGLRQRQWFMQPCCATTGDGLYEGLDWLVNQLKNKQEPSKTPPGGENSKQVPSKAPPGGENPKQVATDAFTWTKVMEKFKAIFVA